ncbi:hypothetical protein G3I38_32490 [Streptomyces sp. SID7958]|uniref:Uncharacterized protein n=2 Tax=unclassified Streptomyces TaxID=2593676 RepID=A0A6G3QNE2_9ACTN|nr:MULTISPECIES: hypothetical protein [unclassified Streptomyces]NEA85009.1 hypothetical protein [Streptomyces sp. SID14436]NEC83828.1 hypothetical protein [Streptomyces sp. SID7958]
MNGNPLYHWVALAVTTVLVLPIPVAILTGWTPSWIPVRKRAGMRLRAYGTLCLYGLVLANGLPRVADASLGTVMTWMNVGFGFIAAACVLFFLAERRDAGHRSRGEERPPATDAGS